MEALKSLNSERGASQWGLVLRLLSLALVTLLAFSSGVWFGKKLSDADYQRVALEGEFGKATQVGSADEASELEGSEPALDDQEALSEADVAKATQEALARAQTDKSLDAKTEVAQSSNSPAPKANSAVSKPADSVKPESGDRTVASTSAARSTASASVPSQKPDLSQAHQAAQRVAQNAAPIEAAKPVPESRVPAALPKTVGATGEFEFTVQVAAYPTIEAAKDHSAKLVDKGFPAFPVEAQVNGKTVYRVSVGSFKTQGEAAKFRISLMKQADIAAAFVTKIARTN